ncbi:MAG: hypothetical protein K1X56_05675 [Flavobacteriales bacterium]|nr:hypothetical protein [Flavobacteriales bacterium]
MSRPYALAISILFHPVFMPIIALFLIFTSDSYLSNNTSDEAKNILYLFVFILTIVMPGLSTFILVRNKMVSHITLPLQKDRTAPYAITIFYYILLYYLLRKIPNIPGPMLSVVLGSIAMLLIILVINPRFQISAHMAGIAGLCGIYIGLSTSDIILGDLFITCLLIIAAGFVGTARLSLGAHRPSEIYSGALLGFLCEYLVIRYHLFL